MENHVSISAFEGVVTETFFRGDFVNLSGDLALLPSSKFKLRLTICLVFFGDLLANFFLMLFLCLAAIFPVVTTFPALLSLLPAPRSICRDVKLVSKLLGLAWKDLDMDLLVWFGITLKAGGCIEFAELGDTEPRAEELDLTLLGCWDFIGEKRLRRKPGRS